MTEENTTRVVYKAIADFSALKRKIREARQELKALQDAEAEYNKNSVLGAKKSTEAHSDSADALDNEREAFERAAASSTKLADGVKNISVQVQKFKKDSNGNWLEETEKGFIRTDAAARMAARGFGSSESAGRRFRAFLDALVYRFATAESASYNLDRGVQQLNRSLVRVGNWRPRMVPPFVALVPIIGAVVAALNPLVALIGAAGGAAIGLAGNLGSLAGVALSLPGIFSAVAASLSGMIIAMGGVGSVFRAYSAMQRATSAAPTTGGTNPTSTGPSPEARADALEAAEDRLAAAQRNAKRAQEGLNRAREQALRNLIDLRIEVARASLNEERALANLQLAREEYYRVLAEPGSTSGDKMDALVRIKEAEADLQDVRRQNIENQKELNEAERKGIEGSDEVVDAKDNLRAALREVRAAQRGMRQEQEQTNQALAGNSPTSAVNAANEFQQALDKLSPSARKFVLGLIAMEDAWNSLRRNVQEAFFSEIVDNLDEINSLLPVFENLWAKAAGAMGRVVSRGIEMLASGPWTRDFATIADSNVKIIESFGDMVLFLMDAFRHLIVAAAPFTEWLTDSLKEGAENFRDMVKTGRETGALATWLEKVRVRLEKWWKIVKNIGATIFNYSAAASEFGDWMSDGFLQMTENWRKASEAAREEDSPFRQWLEDIQPLLSEVRGFFGDFFSWIREESMDPENIQDAQDLLKLLRDDLGPALARLFDTMAKTDVDEKFVESVTAIVEALDGVLEKGGAAGIQTFFDVVTGFFQAIASFVDDLPPSSLEAIAKLLGAIAAVIIINKLTGVTSLFAGLFGLWMKRDGLLGLFNSIKGLDKLKFKGLLAWIGKLGLLLGGAVVVVGQVSNATPVIEDVFNKINDGDYSTIAREGGAQAAIEQGAKDLGRDGSIAKAAVPATLVISEGLGLFNKEWKATFDKNLEGMSTGFFTWLGELGLDLATGWDQITTWWNDLILDLQTGWDQIETWWNDLILDLQTGWDQIETWWNDLFTDFETGWTQIETWWNDLILAFQTGWDQIKTWWDLYVIKPIQRGWALIQMWWDLYVIQPIRRGWLTIQMWWDRYVIQPIRRGWALIQIWWDKFVIRPIARGWAAIQSWWYNTVIRPIAKGWATVQAWWYNFVIRPISQGWATIQRWWNGILEPFRKFDLGKAFRDFFGGWFGGGRGDAPPSVRGFASGTAVSRVQSVIGSVPGLRITDTLSSPARDRRLGLKRSANSYHYDTRNPAVDIAGPISALHRFAGILRSMGGWRQFLWQTAGHYDHIHVANRGGSVPGVGNKDTVPFLLTPGEFVIRKEIVQRIGEENIARLNSGTISYQEMLHRALASTSSRRSVGTGSGFGFDGSGLVPGLSIARTLASTRSALGSDQISNVMNNTQPGFNVEQLHVHNPVPETVSETLPRTVRKLVYTTSGQRSGR